MVTSRFPRTVADLQASGYTPRSVRAELRTNAVQRIEQGEPLFPGIIGYEDTVLPQLETALLAGQDIIILGERGQAKSRLIRLLPQLLDEVVPVVEGCPINDDPLRPICKACCDRARADGDKLAVEWLPRDRRFGEKLATPDVSMADLIGDIDPIKVAEGRYLSDELTIHYGLIPRSNRGIFSINELPDLSERIQVGLFNLMEERDIQIKGFNVRLPLDVFIVATANPEDYTNRGRIITPLKDRYGAQVRTHYPLTTEHELRIVDQERERVNGLEDRVVMPELMADLVARLTSLARASSDINQRSGVSVRVSIANYETLMGAALRRALRHGEEVGAPRITDLPALGASMRGKIEMETIEEGQEVKVIDTLTKKAVAGAFAERMREFDFTSILQAFESGSTVEVGSDTPAEQYAATIKSLDGMGGAIERLRPGKTPAERAAALEFILEGLHLDRKLNRNDVGGRVRYARRPTESPLSADSQGRERRRRYRRDRE